MTNLVAVPTTVGDANALAKADAPRKLASIDIATSSEALVPSHHLLRERVDIVVTHLMLATGSLNLHPDRVAETARILAECGFPPSVVCERLVECGGLPPAVVDNYMAYLLPHMPFDEQLTDTGAALRLIAIYGHDIRYCPGIGWFVWTGREWRVDTEDLQLMQKATACARTWREDAAVLRVTASLELDTSKRQKKEERAFAVRSFAASGENRARIHSAIALARSDPRVQVDITDLDTDADLINVQNGVVDLATGKLRPHDRKYHMTQISPVGYYPDATSDEWVRFIDQLTDGDKDLQDYLQKCVGYSLSGDPCEENLLFFYGPGGSGKGTFIDVIDAVMGSYAVRLPFDVLVQRPNGSSGPNPELVRLRGKRLVIASEVDDGKSLSAGLIKNLTGRDTITARGLYKDLVDFRPQFTLVLVANHQPNVGYDDSGMWRRIKTIPLEHKVLAEERDPELKTRLRSTQNLEAVLAWAIDGHRKWRQEGLSEPSIVKEATASYRASGDAVGAFIEECCETGPQLEVETASLRGRYDDWATENHEPDLTPKAFANQLKAHGMTAHKVKGNRGWRGLALPSQGKWQNAFAARPQAALPPGKDTSEHMTTW